MPKKLLLLTLTMLMIALGNFMTLAQSTTKNATQKAFLKLLDRPRVPLAAQEKTLAEENGVQKIHFSFASEAGERVTGLLLKKSNAQSKSPVVVALHGTGGNKEGQLPLLQELVAQGFIAVAIDGRFHGERSPTGKGAADYVAAILQTYRTGKGHPFLYDTVWDVMRLVDYLSARPDVEAARIGMIGFSKGGMELYLAAAVDPRIAVSVPCIGVQSFRWAIENNAWQSRAETFQAALNSAAQDANAKPDADFLRKFYDRVVPGIYAQFDGPKMVPLIAPRPLLVINGDSDARTPIPGLEECIVPTKAAYEKMNAKEKFLQYLQPKTGHAVTPIAKQMAIDWFVKWLK